MSAPQAQPPPARYLTYKHAAAYMGMSVPALRWHVAQGRLPICYLGGAIRLDRYDLDAAMDAGRWDQPGFKAARAAREAREARAAREAPTPPPPQPGPAPTPQPGPTPPLLPTD